MISEKSFKQIPKTNVENTLQISNKYKDVSLSDFAKILNNIDTTQRDDDLDIVMNLLISLDQSIQICKQFMLDGNQYLNNPIYNFHYPRIKHLTKTLEQFTWFNELKEKSQRFNFVLEEINN